MKITISKEQFEQYVIAAVSSRTQVYDEVSSRFEHEYSYLIEHFVGDEKYLENEKIIDNLSRVVSLSSFLYSIPSLDLVLTPTGFGVVSTSEVAPASPARVKALEDSLKMEYLRGVDKLVDSLRGEEWGKSNLAFSLISTLLYSIDLCKDYGLKIDNAESYMSLRLDITAADIVLRDVISAEYMEELLDNIRCAKHDERINHQLRQLLSFKVLNNESAYGTGARQLINMLESNISDYSTYAASAAHKSNTYVGFQNTKDSPAFVFAG